jgi:hypothetical protein
MSDATPVEGAEQLQAAGELEGVRVSGRPPVARVSAADPAGSHRKKRRRVCHSLSSAADSLCSPYSFLFTAAASASLFSSSVILASGQLPFPWINTVDTASPLTFFPSCQNVATDSAPAPEDAAARIDWAQPVVDASLLFDCCSCDERVGCSAAGGCSCALYTGARYSKPGSRRLAAAQPGAENATLITECNSRCRCASFAASCGNRVVQAAPVSCGLRLLVFKTADRGWGLLTLQSIPSRSYVCEYIGEVVSEQAAELQREPGLHSGNERFLFDTGGRFALEPPVIDAHRVGHIARFINHSCEPNLAVYQVLQQQRSPHILHFSLFTCRPVQQGEELCFDYKYGKTERQRLFQGACRCPGCKRRRQQSADGQRQP